MQASGHTRSLGKFLRENSSRSTGVTPAVANACVGKLNGTTHDLEWTNTLVTNVGGEKRTHRRNGLTRSIIEYRHHRGVACQAWVAVFDQPNEPGTNE